MRKRPAHKRHYKYERTLKGKYRKLRGRSKFLGAPLKLSFEDFCQLSNLPCHYCGATPEQNHTGSRLDRIDNSKGYSRNNVVPCCWQCNNIRGATLSVEEMYVIIGALTGFRRTKKIA